MHVLSLLGAVDAEEWEQWDWHEREATRVLDSLEATTVVAKI